MAGLLVRGGPVHTGDPARPVVDALAVVDGVVVARGEAALHAVGRGAQVIDLAGGCALPGFRDGHIHPLSGGVGLAAAPLATASTLGELFEVIRTFADEHPDQRWITGGGYLPTLAPDGQFDAAWLDAVVPDRPAVLMATDYHTAWANTAALERAGIDAGTPDPARGQIVRRADGTPQGTLREAAVDLVTRYVPPLGEPDKQAGLRRAMALLAGHGIVAVQEAALEQADLGVYLDLAAAGGLPMDVAVALRVEPDSWREQLEEFAAARSTADQAAAQSGPPGPGHGRRARVRARTVKLFADGVIEAGTAHMLEPYAGEPPTGTPLTGGQGCGHLPDTGLPNFSPAELAEVVTAFDARGWQVHVHAIGDAAVRSALDAVDAAQRANGPRDRRAVIAHTQVVHPQDVHRFARLGVVANFEPLWAQQDSVMVELTEPRLGAHRSGRQYPIGELLASGARVSFGSDWPVTSAAPLEGICTAVTRQTDTGQPPGGWQPEQRVTLAEALAAYTSGTAYQCFDDTAGRLVEGAPADFVVLDADLSRVPARELADVPVLSTWRAGERTTP